MRNSFLWVCNATGVHEAMDALNGDAAISDVSGGAAATSGAFALEGPSEADRLPRVLGDVNVVPFHHF